MSMKEKYLNWLSLIETDYITMFIKTWFTFLASLQESIDNVNDGSIGDSRILTEYENKLFEEIPIQLNEEFVNNVLKAYLQAKNSTLNSDIFLKDYFEIFYSYTENYFQEFSYAYRGKTTKLILNIFKENKGTRHIKIVLEDERQKFKNYFGQNIETGFSLSDEVKKHKIFENKNVFIIKVLAAIKEKAKHITDKNGRLDNRGRQRRINFIKDECLKDIEIKLRDEFNIESIFPLRPNNVMSALNSNTIEIPNKPQFFDENLTKWFIDFAYKLRNILFHFIIDPMNENWQSLFKYTYLALKHLTEENIRLLQERGAENDNSSI